MASGARLVRRCRLLLNDDFGDLRCSGTEEKTKYEPGHSEPTGTGPNGGKSATYLEVGDRLDPEPPLPSEDVLRNCGSLMVGGL